ncbi:MAG: signal peptidase II [Eubacteriaceae bacterium]|nr:signal peptidase II [Eubacteriaceae bacterium]
MLFYLLCIALLVAVDQAVKLLAVKSLSKVDTIPLLKNIFHLTYVENTGASFGILQGRAGLLAIASIVISVLFIYLLFDQYQKDPSKIAFLASLSLIIAGGVGNLIDRAFRGFVIDLFDFRLINFAVFNVADAMISMGAVVFCICVLFDKELLASF